MKTEAVTIIFLLCVSAVAAWGEGNTQQTYFIHWQPQKQECEIQGQLLTLNGYLWKNQSTNETECIPFGNRRAMSGLSGETSVLTDQEPSKHASGITVKENFPQDRSYVFICNEEGTSFDWDFGDGHKLYDLQMSDVFHTYDEPGAYHVTCVANAHGVDSAAWKTVTIHGIAIQAPYPKGSDYVFTCMEEGMTFDWDFGDGQKLYDQERNDIYHTFAQPGDYQVTCVANDGVHNNAVWRTISVVPEQTMPMTMLYLTSYEYQTAVLRCEERNFDANYFDWDFGDSTSITTSSNSVMHTYVDGQQNHTASCTARNAETSATDTIIVHP